ncbi:hypothetical protein DIU36_06030 [Mucilaginibacter rubeus]|nr:hypothetical protein DIU36_06030 [Mucilaginibacter rubeus]
MIKAIDMRFPVILVGLVFFGLIAFTCMANTALLIQLTSINREVGQTINSTRFTFMDSLSPHFGSYSFWIPFYCSVILLLIGFDRVKFLKTCVLITVYLVIAGVTAYGLDSIGERLFLQNCAGFHYKYTALIPMDCSLVCLNATLAFGAAIFVSLYLGKKFVIIKVLLLLFALIIIYNLIYAGDDLPASLALGMITGLLCAFACRVGFKKLEADERI